ncbi:hypothetical protein Tco_0582340, partial [Tanacetum coccineum]
MSFGLMKSVTPKAFAFSLFSGLVSTPIILDAPLILAPCATDNPTVPKPKLATVDPLVTSATFQAAPKPAAVPQL